MTIQSTARKLGRLCRGYAGDTRGNLTMLFGLSAIPVIAAAGMAIDYARISRVHERMQFIADGATLAAASAKNLGGSSTQKKASRVLIATNYLDQGLEGLTDADIIGSPTVTATTTSVSVSVKAEVKGSLINVLDGIKKDADVAQGDGGNQAGDNGGRTFDIEVTSKASWNAGLSYVCLLALNQSVSQALHVKGTADINATNCAVWDNSSSNSGLYQNGNATITAGSINVVGNYSGGNFSPTPSTGVAIFADPLASKFATEYQTAYDVAAVRNATKVGGKWKALDFAASGTFTIESGIYKGGITIKNNRNIIMNPGIYFIEDGGFDVQAGGVVDATAGVTIIMTDTNAATTVTSNSSSTFQIQAQGSLTIKAPSTGSFSSIAVAQHPNSRPDVNKKEDYIIGGGAVDVTGIMYFPSQKFYVTGSGDVSTTSTYFAIVADQIYIEGNGQLNISQASDFEAAGLPALPTSGSGDAKVSLR